MPQPIYPTNTRVWEMWRNAFSNWWNKQAQTNRFVGAVDEFLNGPSGVESLNIMDNPAIALLSGGPAFKKLQSFEELENLRRAMEAAEEGKTLVNAAKNTRAGRRPRMRTTSEPRYVKTIPLSQSPEAIAAKEAAAQQAAVEARAAQVKSNQIDLARSQRRSWEEQGINTTAAERKAMMKAIEVNPGTSTPPPEGAYRAPYQSGITEWEGVPIKDWLDMATEGNLPYGPNALWRKWERPLQSATRWHDSVGPVLVKDELGYGFGASQTALDMLGQGLSEIAPYLKKQGGIVSAKSGIHIKKANRGKFTDYCGGKVTSECIARGKKSSNPAVRKRATFAANARRWKHSNGGIIMPNWAKRLIGGLNNAKK